MTRRLPGFVPPEGVDSPSTGAFWRELAKGRLTHQVCGDCGEAFFPPRPACPACLSLELSWKEMPARGSLASWTRIRRSTADFETPLLLGLVDLESGLGRLLAPLVDVDETALAIGMPVRLEIVPTESGPALWCATVDGRSLLESPRPR